MRIGKCSDCGRTRRFGGLAGDRYVVGADNVSGMRAHKLAAVLAGAILIFIFTVGCTPDSSSSSSGGPVSSTASVSNPMASNPTLVTGSTNDSLGSPVALNRTSETGGTNELASDAPGDWGDNSIAGDPGADSPDNGPSAGMPEPATCFLFLCAAGSMALARLRARKRG